MDVHISWMVRRDMAEVLQIERAVFAYPWSEEDFIRSLRVRNSIGMVAKCGDEVVGFMIYELHSHALNIMNIAVHPEYQRRSVGTHMINKLKGKLSPNRRHTLCCDIRESNLDGQLWLREMGFRATGIVHEPWAETDEDAYHMVYGLHVPTNRIANYV